MPSPMHKARRYQERQGINMENWKDIKGFEGLYQVSDQGRVYSIRTGKILVQQPRRHGYLAVFLYGTEKRANGRYGKPYSVHRLVAEAFCKREEGQTEVNHLNEVKDDNRAENLEWCTHKENSTHGTRGSRIGRALLNGERSKKVYQYSIQGELIKEYPSLQEVIRQNGYSLGNISLAIAKKRPTAYGYIWTH